MHRGLCVASLSPEETRILGAALAPVLLPGDVLSLGGDLGAGKTTFVQGLGTALGVRGRITSPSFMIVHEYVARYPIIHVDVYRLDSFQQVLDLGFEELMEPEAVLIVEWGDAVAPLLPPRFLEVEIRAGDAGAPNERLITFRARGSEWIHKLAAMRQTAEALLDAASPEVSSTARFSEAS